MTAILEDDRLHHLRAVRVQILRAERGQFSCSLCEWPITEKEGFHVTVTANSYCDDCWTDRVDDILSIEGEDSAQK